VSVRGVEGASSLEVRVKEDVDWGDASQSAHLSVQRRSTRSNQ